MSSRARLLTASSRVAAFSYSRNAYSSTNTAIRCISSLPLSACTKIQQSNTKNGILLSRFAAIDASSLFIQSQQAAFTQLQRTFATSATSVLSEKPAATSSNRNAAVSEESSTAEESSESNGIVDEHRSTTIANPDSRNTNRKFSEIKALSPSTLNALQTAFKYDTMTEVQDKVLSQTPTTSDLLVRARTGTGKTLAFLIASLESIIHQANSEEEYKNMVKTGKGISVMILSPTRELALQIGREATMLLRNTHLRVHCMVGGNDKRRQMMDFNRNRCDFVVATPGRLLDLLSSEKTFRSAAQYTRTIIFDEADTLLEMGFKEELTSILQELPPIPLSSKSPRQTMMFSATLSPAIRSIAKSMLQPNGKYIDTIPEHEIPTHLKIKQSGLLVPYSLQLPVLYHVIMNHIRTKEKDVNGKPAKIMVFCPSTAITQYMAMIFKDILTQPSASSTPATGYNRFDIFEIHSRLAMPTRTNINTRFRTSVDRPSILFTSDVSARGVDYPGVSLVVQIGQATDKDQYIHRIGRTARAGKSGEAIMILSPYERGFVNRDLAELPVDKKEIMNLKMLNLSDEDQVVINEKLPAVLKKVDTELIETCYGSWLGYYGGIIKKNLGVETFIRASHEFGRGVLGAKSDSDLAISHRQAQNHGLSHVRGVIIRNDNERSDSRFRGSDRDSNRGFRRDDGDFTRNSRESNAVGARTSVEGNGKGLFEVLDGMDHAEAADKQRGRRDARGHSGNHDRRSENRGNSRGRPWEARGKANYRY